VLLALPDVLMPGIPGARGGHQVLPLSCWRHQMRVAMSGNTIKESLDERSQAIQTELQNFLNYKKPLNELLKEHEKVFLFLKKLCIT